ncbi:MAG: hypothetical protein JXR97_17235, partial [Planctomycetes bacterium]|nr:hypothetical protein [Planctomycetota bacterium]
ILGMHASSPIPDPRDYNQEISKEASNIVVKMLAKDPTKRFQTPGEVLGALEAYFSAHPTKSTKLKPSGEHTEFGETWLGPPEIGSDTELLDSVGEDDKQLRRMAPLLFAAGVSLLLMVFAISSLIIRNSEEKAKKEKDAKAADEADDETKNGEEALTKTQDKANEEEDENKYESATQREVETDSHAPELSQKEKDASALYKQALMASGAEQERLFRKAANDYKGTAAAKLANQELAIINKRKRDVADAAQRKKLEEQERQRQLREQKALDAYIEANTKITAGEDAYMAALGKVAADYKGTEAGEKAAAQLSELQSKIARQKKLEEEEKRRREAEARREKREERNRERDEVMAKFFKVYLDALGKFDLATAGKYAKLLSEDKRNPGLNKFGADCGKDIAILSELYPCVEKALHPGLGGQQTITFGKGSTITGDVRSVREGIIYILKGAAVIQLPLTEISDEDTERLFRAEYKKKSPSPELVLALYHMARGNTAQAEALFASASKGDPLRNHHRNLMNSIKKLATAQP